MIIYILSQEIENGIISILFSFFPFFFKFSIFILAPYFLKDLLIYLFNVNEYTVAVLRHTRRGQRTTGDGGSSVLEGKRLDNSSNSCITGKTGPALPHCQPSHQSKSGYSTGGQCRVSQVQNRRLGDEE